MVLWNKLEILLFINGLYQVWLNWPSGPEKMNMYKRLRQRQPNGENNNDGKRTRFDQNISIKPLAQVS